MTNQERRNSGMLYITDDAVMEEQAFARRLTHKLNTMDRSDYKGIQAVVRELLGKSDNAWINPPFYCDYGKNIEVGKNFFANYNCTILDVGTVTIGDNCQMAPNVAIYTAGHPLHPDTRRTAWEYVAKIILSALPAVAVYFLFKKSIDDLFENARMVGAFLMFTGVVLAGTRFLPRGLRPVGFLHAFLMGCGQAVAILPGVSRSGMTLASARAGRVAPEAAAEFSFLMSAPLIAGDALLHIWKAFKATPAEVAGEPSWGVVACGAVIAAVVGYFSLAILLRTLRGRWFWLFGPYCFTAGLLVICFCK